ncbi:MAG: NAD(P)-dependent oxidoreductase, partial [Bdellovibrionales bacterium]|nr:NAD(P)-dependent oxidoreductase [Bdellovibrionales bacterium]
WGNHRWAAEHVVHSAGVVMASSPEEYASVNVAGTVNLLAKLDQPQKILILSSHAAAGPCDPSIDVRRENHPDAPVTWYGQSKLEMERAAKEKFPDLPCLYLRPPMILGPRDSASLPLFVLGKQWLQVKPGLREKLYSFIAVDDLISAIETALRDATSWSELAHRHYFVCAPKPVSDRSLLRGAAATFEKPGRILPIPLVAVRALSALVGLVPAWSRKIPNLSPDRAREIWPDRWVISPAAFEKRFGWSAAQDLDATLEAASHWYQQAGLL